MCCPFRVRVSTLRVALAFLALCTVVACRGASSEGGAAGTSGNAPVLIEVSQTYITVENRTGAPLVGGQLTIVPVGILPPFKATLPRLETGARREITLNSFRGNDGTPFNRSVTRGRRVTVTAKDLTGKVYESEVPFK